MPKCFKIHPSRSRKTHEHFAQSYQTGGKLTLVCDSWASRIEKKGVDPYNLGRWLYIILRGKGTKWILFITAYRVSADIASPMTAAMQQYRKISQANRNVNILAWPLPRRQLILDLQAWLETYTIKGYQIILAMDANSEYVPQSSSIMPLLYKDGHHNTMAP